MTRATTALDLRKARMRDIPAMLRLINGYAAKAIMLPRTELDLAENIRDFTVAYSGGDLAGCGALHYYTPTSAEVRSLAVADEFKGAGAGRAIVETLEEEAHASSLDAIFAFTYVPGFFRRLGFSEVERGDLPLKAWKDCMRCPKFHCCDEIAMLKPLRGDVLTAAHTRSDALLQIVPALPQPRAH
jgi:amino-acid N-acetyltransferase